MSTAPSLLSLESSSTKHAWPCIDVTDLSVELHIWSSGQRFDSELSDDGETSAPASKI